MTVEIRGVVGLPRLRCALRVIVRSAAATTTTVRASRWVIAGALLWLWFLKRVKIIRTYLSCLACAAVSGVELGSVVAAAPRLISDVCIAAITIAVSWGSSITALLLKEGAGLDRVCDCERVGKSHLVVVSY